MVANVLPLALLDRGPIVDLEWSHLRRAGDALPPSIAFGPSAVSETRSAACRPGRFRLEACDVRAGRAYLKFALEGAYFLAARRKGGIITRGAQAPTLWEPRKRPPTSLNGDAGMNQGIDDIEQSINEPDPSSGIMIKDADFGGRNRALS